MYPLANQPQSVKTITHALAVVLSTLHCVPWLPNTGYTGYTGYTGDHDYDYKYGHGKHGKHGKHDYHGEEEYPGATNLGAWSCETRVTL
jgi:hypothetical protein